MPSSIIHNKVDEANWKKAKQAAHKSYPKMKETDSKFWKIVMTIFKSMNKEDKNKSTASEERWIDLFLKYEWNIY